MLGRATKLAALGVAIALSVARVMNTMLYGLESTDASTYAAILLPATPIVILAAAIPAWRAAQADPVDALRAE